MKKKKVEEKKSAAPVRGLAAALAELRRKLPGRVMFTAPMQRSIPMRHVALGRLLAGDASPGIPTGKFFEILGEAHSGKTTLTFAMMDAVINQPKDARHAIQDQSGKVQDVPAPRRALYLDFEHALDTRYLSDAIRNLVIANVDPDGEVTNADAANLWIHRPETLEEGTELAIQMIGSGEFGIVVVDSVPAMLPMEERDKTMEQSTVGKHAAAMGKFFRRTAGVISRYGIVVVLVNQWRDKIGVVFGDPRRAPGGKAMAYYDSIKIDVSGPKGSDWFPEGGKTANIKTMKNKVTGKLGVVSYQLGTSWGLSPEVELSEMMIAAGLLKSTGPGRPVVVYPGKNDSRTFPDRQAWLRHLRNGSERQWQALLAECRKRGAVVGASGASRSSESFNPEA